LADVLLSMKGISKSFPGVRALDHVDFDLVAGEVHVLAGQNGAGKSTLIKILTGAYAKDSGHIFLNGQEIEIRTPSHALALGITAIYQELNLIPYLTVGENIYLGREPRRLFGTSVDWRRLHGQARQQLTSLGIEGVDTGAYVGALGVGLQQMVEIAKALSQNAQILIMDEPTSALSEREIEVLFATIKRLKQAGVGIIYISHRLKEVQQIGDRVSVIRDGSNVGTLEMKEASVDRIAAMMVGREVKGRFLRERQARGPELLRVQGLSRGHMVKDISFSLHAGEVLGIAGVMGSGRTELVRALFGADRREAGLFFLEGKQIEINSPEDAVRSGIALLTEDRKRQGLVLDLSVASNISLAALRRFTALGAVSQRKEADAVQVFVAELNIRTPSLRTEVQYLSGGNQQKVVLAKWLCTQSKVFIFDEPTRGIDVGAKVEIAALINELAKDGAGVIMISSELEELVALADRILIMQRGRIIHELDHKDATEEVILKHALGESEKVEAA
jgi:ribose transport system ATP-binding protein